MGWSNSKRVESFVTPVLAALLIVGCSGSGGGDDGKNGDDGTGSDAGGGSDSSALCDEDITSELTGPDCLSGTLSCGDEITGNTEGGTSVGTSEAYEAWFCTPRFEEYDGPDRVYALEVDGGQDVEVTLTSPCAELDLFMAKWVHEECPTAASLVPTCKADTNDGGGTVESFSSNDTRYLIYVDSQSGVAGNFSLSVSCTPH